MWLRVRETYGVRIVVIEGGGSERKLAVHWRSKIVQNSWNKDSNCIACVVALSGPKVID